MGDGRKGYSLGQKADQRLQGWEAGEDWLQRGQGNLRQ